MYYGRVRQQAQSDPQYHTDHRLSMIRSLTAEQYEKESEEVRAEVRKARSERVAEIRRERNLKSQALEGDEISERKPEDYLW